MGGQKMEKTGQLSVEENQSLPSPSKTLPQIFLFQSVKHHLKPICTNFYEGLMHQKN